MALRVLHLLTAAAVDPQQLADEARALRAVPGCSQADVYRPVADGDQLVVVQLWEDEAAFDTSLDDAVSGGVTPGAIDLARRDETTTEIYRHTPFAPRDGRWVAETPGSTARVRWPAAGPVRIVIQSCFAQPDDEIPSLLENQAETRREPGCEEYGWYQGLDDPRHILLLELWSDQQSYDRHWALRQRTGQHSKPRERAERSHGSNGAEFYRAQAFRHLYGSWLPSDPAAWSSTVDWPC